MSEALPSSPAWTIQQQILCDEVTGMTLHFFLRPDGAPRMRIEGPTIPLGSREIGFDEAGAVVGERTHDLSAPTPGWITGPGRSVDGSYPAGLF